ncbi:MAG TPA: bidirectional hydrogenase complex protein HoxE [Dissulfurispiraceae bacterium]|nr:bidirectional hydrogenase complex protein HoxE [Dissulfurispiraceae bacterium]
MDPKPAVSSAPSKQPEDRRWRMVDRAMRLHGFQPHALIETLHAVQESFGYLDMDALKYVADGLKVPLSQVYGVATFYHFFSLKPAGEHTCVVCMGTACYIGGAAEIIKGVGEQYKIAPGETTRDGKLSLVVARCIGSCGLAPAVVFDNEVDGKSTPKSVLEKLGRWTNS